MCRFSYVFICSLHVREYRPRILLSDTITNPYITNSELIEVSYGVYNYKVYYSFTEHIYGCIIRVYNERKTWRKEL